VSLRELTPEQREIRDLAARFAAERIAPNAAAWDREHTFPRALFDDLGKLGLMGVCVPEEQGGAGADFLSYALVLEELARADAGVGVTVAVHTSACTLPLLDHGSEYVPALAAGEEIGAFALTEAGSGSDAAAMRTRYADGRISGSKQWCTNGSHASTFLVFARDERSGDEREARGSKRVSAFVVRAGAEGFEEQLVGAQAGDEKTVSVTFPEASASGDEREARGSGAEELAGNEAEFAVTVKEVKAKELPPLDDDLAIEAGFDTLDELRADIRERLSEAEERRIEAEFREAVLDSAVANATIDVPDALVEARSRELWDQMLHSLSHQGISREMYLQISGRSEEEIVAEGKADAERQLRREAVLAAVVAAESIEPSEDELLEALEQAAPSEGTSAKKLLERMRSAGRLDALRAELAQRKALDLVAESATPISVEQARARDKLWTPGADAAERPAQLWTPGS